MKKTIFTGLFLTIFFQIQGQLSDDFSDGNLAKSPVWFGDTSDFLVNDSFQLQLNAESSGISRLYTSLKNPSAVRWDMYFNLQFATSASNKIRIYLLLDTTDLAVANGYYIEIGQNGAPDPLHFFSLENGENFLLGSSTLAFEQEVQLDLSILRADNGTWTFYAATENDAFNEILTLSDATFVPENGKLFCLECYYTTTRKDKFSFDDIHVFPLVPDTIAPVLIGASAIDSVTIELNFNENIGADIQVKQIRIEPDMGNPTSIQTSNHILRLAYENTLSSGKAYTCMTSQISDTARNFSGIQEASFGYIKTSTPLPGNLVINEILFDPKPDDSPFIELINVSDMFLNCSDLVLSIEKNNAWTNFSSTTDLLIYPDSFIVFTSDRLSTITNYPSSRANAILEVDLPGMSRDFGSITLQTRTGKIIDSVYYNVGFHHMLLDETRGVSLERISPTSPALRHGDWNSASAQSGWGTPGLPNSQYIRFDTVTSVFHIENQFFSPDGDGHEDFLLIRFADRASGKIATARIYDEFGREVSVIFRNLLIGTDSTGKWDGTIDAQGIAPTGIYILLIEMMNETGIVNSYKEAVTLATGF
ncbi:MAG: hypothetical protein DRI69_06100 [Bacteroidetes bacterium]|nr:MAG: hypothetical protein DRI69_06100 [Bacteroidota bacterium]